MQTRLLEANSKQIDAPLAEVEQLLTTVLEGWNTVTPAALPVAEAGLSTPELHLLDQKIASSPTPYSGTIVSAHARASSAVEVQNLRKVYGNKAAVDGLSLTVAQGSFFGFLGPNGAGKTTTIKMLMGLAPPTSGSIRLLGMAMPEQGLEIKQLIGLVPDESLLFDHLTGGEFVEFVGRMYGLEQKVARDRSLELLELFELDGNQKKLIVEYSKGMRKRAAMAAALDPSPQTLPHGRAL